MRPLRESVPISLREDDRGGPRCRRDVRAFVAWLCVVAPVLGQSWTVTASAPVQGTSTTSVNAWPLMSWSTSATLPVGAVSAGQFLVTSVSGSGNQSAISATWVPAVPNQVAPLAFAVSTSWSGIAPFSGSANGSLQAQLDFVLHAPHATNGRLRLRTAPNQPWLAVLHTLAVDVGADGVVDYQTLSQQLADLPLSIPAAGAVVRVSMQITGFTTSSMGSAAGHVGVTAEFFPGEPVLSVFDVTGAGTALTWQQVPGQVTLTLGSPADTPLLLVFGAQPIVVPVFPTVTALVTLDAFYATGTMVLPAVPLPPGTAIYVQGLVLDATSTLRSSPSVRALW